MESNFVAEVNYYKKKTSFRFKGQDNLFLTGLWKCKRPCLGLSVGRGVAQGDSTGLAHVRPWVSSPALPTKQTKMEGATDTRVVTSKFCVRAMDLHVGQLCHRGVAKGLGPDPVSDIHGHVGKWSCRSYGNAFHILLQQGIQQEIGIVP